MDYDRKCHFNKYYKTKIIFSNGNDFQIRNNFRILWAGKTPACLIYPHPKLYPLLEEKIQDTSGHPHFSFDRLEKIGEPTIYNVDDNINVKRV